MPGQPRQNLIPTILTGCIITFGYCWQSGTMDAAWVILPALGLGAWVANWIGNWIETSEWRLKLAEEARKVCEEEMAEEPGARAPAKKQGKKNK